jgi:DNA-binding XRE family transcriptional regulator
MALGHRIRDFRIAAGLTKTELANLSGVPVKSIHILEDRDSQKSMYTAAIARALNVETDELLGFTRVGGSLNEPPATYAHSPSAPRAKMVRLKVSEVLRPDGNGLLDASSLPAEEMGFVDVVATEPGLKAIRVRGDALSPAIEDGEVLLIRNAGVCTPGSKVLLTMGTGKRLVKRLLFERSDAFTVADLATSQQSTIERPLIHTAEPVIAVYSADSWRHS